jgi:hypothetical protein
VAWTHQATYKMDEILMANAKIFGLKKLPIRHILFVLVFFIFLGLLILLAFLPMNGAIDFEVYNICLINGGYQDWEPGMNLICSFTSQFSPSWAVNIPRFASIVILAITTYLIGKRFGITSSFFFILLNGFQMLGAYRQGYATILLCFAILAIAERKRIQGWLSLLTAVTFHFSSLIMFFIVLYAKYAKIWISIAAILLLLFIEPLISLFLGLGIIPDATLFRYINLANTPLPARAYLQLGKLWYLIYYFTFLIMLFRYFRDNRFDNFRKIYIAFIPLIIAVPVLTIMDSWIAVRLSSLTNPVELLFFVKSASNFQKLFMLGSYFVRTGVAFLNFFIFNGVMFN